MHTVDEAFDEFSNIFSNLYELNFPLIKHKFNKNVHKINNFMTAGLLISRLQKIKLQKIAANSRLPADTLKFKQYMNLFNSLVKASKKLYFEQNLHNNKGNPKRTWELLKEATNLVKPNCNIEKIRTNNTTTDNPTKWRMPLTTFSLV